MNNGDPNEIFQFAAGHRNISLPRRHRDSPLSGRLWSATPGHEVFGLGRPRTALSYLPFSFRIPLSTVVTKRAEKEYMKSKGDGRGEADEIAREGLLREWVNRDAEIRLDPFYRDKCTRSRCRVITVYREISLFLSDYPRKRRPRS